MSASMINTDGPARPAGEQSALEAASPEARALYPVAAPDGPSPEARAAAIVAEARTSFAAGMRVLSKPRRRAMYAVYAFARIVDDVADGDFAPEQKRALLDAWRTEMERVYAGAPVSPIGCELFWAQAAFDLPKAEFLALIDGMEMDAGAPIVAPDLDTLSLYARRVAGAVGLLSMRCFGAWVGPPSERFALALGDALQFTNILRDVAEDATIGRLYLPREMLERQGVSTSDPKAAAADPKTAEVCAELGALARARFAAARAEIAAHPRGRLAPALMMMGVYEGYLNRIAARNYRLDLGAVTLSKPQKLALSVRYALAPPPAPRR